MFIPINQVSTCYTNNSNKANSFIDLIFFWANSGEFNNYSILPDLQSLSDHTLLTIYIIINEDFIQDKYQTIIKNSEEEEKFC